MNRRNRKWQKRYIMCIRRIFLLVATSFAAASVIAIFYMVAKAVFIVDRSDHMLLPMLLTMLGVAGALAKLAEWLSGKEQG